MKNPPKNLGVILGYRPTDYVGGALPYEIRNPSGNWRPYVTTGEIQYGRDDWMDCVSRSLTNSVEIQEKFFTGKESNYCDREVALGSETTRQGNYLHKVADYVRKTGLGQQATYPDSNGGWDEQYQIIPGDVQVKLNAEKATWKERWDIKDEDVPVTKASLRYHLKHAPLQVVIPGHAIVDVNSEADVERIFDSYEPFQKDVPGGYAGPIIFAKKIVLYSKYRAIPDEYLLVDIKYLDAGKQVEKLINALVQLGWTDCKDWYPVLDDRLATYVLRFQLANLSRLSWSFWWAAFYYKGRLVDQETRSVINNNLQKRP